MNGRENIASFRFSGESQAALRELFSSYPPNAVDMSGNKLDISRGKSDSGVSRDDFFCRPTTNPSEIASKIQTLASRIEKETSLKQVGNPVLHLLEIIVSNCPLVCRSHRTGPSFLLHLLGMLSHLQ